MPPGAQSVGFRDQRSTLNDYLINSNECDAVVDWDRTIRNDDVPDTFKAEHSPTASIPTPPVTPP